MKALYIVLGLILLAGCAPSPEELTATAAAARAQTQTAAPTRTPTRTPTSTPKPTSTATLTPTNTPEPTPAAVGETVQYNDLEITVLEVGTHTQLMFGWSGWDAITGYIFVDMAVLVRNRGDGAIQMTMGDTYVVEENGDARIPFAGGFQTVELEKRFNPMANIKVETLYGGEEISVKKDTYLRLVFTVQEHQEVLFGIQDSPQFLVSVE
jgi:hypothetical protein